MVFCLNGVGAFMEFEVPYRYPDHLTPEVADLPSSPGVYVFHGDGVDLPLYIGKSINIRTRVLSHLRTPEEARMLHQTKRITHIPTAGEIGALLLESKMIKQDFPLFNKRLRRSRQLCSLRLSNPASRATQVPQAPEIVDAKAIDFSKTEHLYGLFNSHRSALEHLKNLADDNKLCYTHLGLERSTQGKPCFRSQLHLCEGACCGRESVAEHHARLLACLAEMQVNVWPHTGALGLIERYPPNEAHDLDLHVVRNWCHLGTVHDVATAKALARVDAHFDADAYKILCKPILSGSVEMVAL
jgi:excinuclease Cho